MSFDAQAFLDSTVTGSNDTKVIPVPVGEYTGIISKVVPRQWTSKDGTSSGISLDVLWSVEDEAVKSALGRSEVVCKQGIMLDTLANGSLDMAKGKNIGLGRLREALKLNDHKTKFSFAMLPGLAARISVTHRVAGEETYSEVKGVAQL